MKLYYILYNASNKTPKYLLVLPLGNRGNKLCLITTELPNQEIELIKSEAKQLDNLSLDGKIRWIQHNCPYAYKNAYKEIKHVNFKIINQYNIDK